MNWQDKYKILRNAQNYNIQRNSRDSNKPSSTDQNGLFHYEYTSYNIGDEVFLSSQVEISSRISRSVSQKPTQTTGTLDKFSITNALYTLDKDGDKKITQSEIDKISDDTSDVALKFIKNNSPLMMQFSGIRGFSDGESIAITAFAGSNYTAEKVTKETLVTGILSRAVTNNYNEYLDSIGQERVSRDDMKYLKELSDQLTTASEKGYINLPDGKLPDAIIKGFVQRQGYNSVKTTKVYDKFLQPGNLEYLASMYPGKNYNDIQEKFIIPMNTRLKGYVAISSGDNSILTNDEKNAVSGKSDKTLSSEYVSYLKQYNEYFGIKDTSLLSGIMDKKPSSFLNAKLRNVMYMHKM